jgi:hypothetical protein
MRFEYHHPVIPFTRIASTIVALSAWAGLVLQFVDSLQLTGNDAIAALWAMLMYFTILTNLLVAVAFTAVALGYAVVPWVLGGTMLSIVLVGAIYALLLSDIPLGNTSTAALANSLVHRITPVLVVLFWIACVPKGTLQWHDAAYWAVYPFAYLGYVLLRGYFTQRYPYPFIHVAEIGWATTLRNSTGIAIGFITASILLIGIDQLARRSH